MSAEEPTKAELEQEKKDHERQVFLDFCAAADIPIESDTLRQPAPPSPDVEVVVSNRGRVAFELVRLNHPLDLQSRSLLAKAQYRIDSAFDELEQARRDAIVSRFGDAIVTVGFAADTGAREREQALSFLWDALAEIPPGFRDEVPLYRKGAPPALTSIWVQRQQIGKGPWFRTISAGGAFPLQIAQLGRKLRRRYPVGSTPLELLAYIEQGEIQHLNAIDRIREELRACLSASTFNAVWIYEPMHFRAVRVDALSTGV